MPSFANDARYLINKYLVEGLLEKTPVVGKHVREYKRVKKWAGACGYEPGHFYSPIPSKSYVRANAKRIFSDADPLAVNLNIDQQFSLIQTLASFRDELPYDFLNEKETTNLRYRWLNGCQYRYSDVVFLYFAIRHLQPKKIVEVGSGASSAVMLDIDDLFFESSIQLTFIEPYPERLLSFLSETDKNTKTISRKKVQDVPFDVFIELDENDILFVDSSHVSKVGSDLNHIVFEVLPRLKKGVWIHFHDIFFPFELPQEWILSHSKFWNENYLIRAFLMNNDSYEIMLFNTCLQKKYRSWFEKEIPECLLGEEPTGSIWIRKIA